MPHALCFFAMLMQKLIILWTSPNRFKIKETGDRSQESELRRKTIEIEFFLTTDTDYFFVAPSA